MKPSRVVWIAVPIVAVVPLLVAAAGPASAAGATRYVATTGNNTDNDCTDASSPCQAIQYAVDQADAGDTVSVAAGSYAESVVIRESLTITGAGASTTTVTGDGSGPSIFVDGLDTNTVPDVTISNLAASGNTTDNGIDLVAASGTLTDIAASDNAIDGVISGVEGTQAMSQGAYAAASQRAIAMSAATTATARVATAADVVAGHVSITASTLSNNANEGLEVDAGSADISESVVDDNSDGGVVVEGGSASINKSTLDGNTGAGVVIDGSGAEATVTDSTVSHTAEFSDSGGSAFGGGILVFPGGAGTVSESTLDGNTSYGVLVLGGTVNVNNSTVADTATGSSGDEPPPGGLALDDDVPVQAPRSLGPDAADAVTPSLTVVGSIDADNEVPDCASAITDSGYNLDSDGSCGLTETGDHSHAKADIGLLASNGGPTKTILPRVGSPARNAIPLGSANCVKTVKDQRGLPRPDSVSRRCDIGSVEAQVINPKLIATIKAHHHRHGWYSGDVTVVFHCTIGTAALTHKCPSPVQLGSGRHHLHRSIHARDGGSASLHLLVTVDNTGPHIVITGVESGNTYSTPPAIHHACHDSLSGVATCRLSTSHVGSSVHYKVTASDKAGNVAHKTGTYVLAPNTGGLGCIARSHDGVLGQSGPSC